MTHSVEGGLHVGVSNCWNISHSLYSIISNCKGVSFKCSADHQNFGLRKLASLPFLLWRGVRLRFVLSMQILPLSIRTVGLATLTL